MLNFFSFTFVSGPMGDFFVFFSPFFFVFKEGSLLETTCTVPPSGRLPGLLPVLLPAYPPPPPAYLFPLLVSEGDAVLISNLSSSTAFNLTSFPREGVIFLNNLSFAYRKNTSRLVAPGEKGRPSTVRRAIVPTRGVSTALSPFPPSFLYIKEISSHPM